VLDIRLKISCPSDLDISIRGSIVACALPEQDAIYVFVRYRNDTWAKRTRVKVALTGLPLPECISILQVIEGIREKEKDRAAVAQ